MRNYRAPVFTFFLALQQKSTRWLHVFIPESTHLAEENTRTDLSLWSLESIAPRDVHGEEPALRSPAHFKPVFLWRRRGRGRDSCVSTGLYVKDFYLWNHRKCLWKPWARPVFNHRSLLCFIQHLRARGILSYFLGRFIVRITSQPALLDRFLIILKTIKGWRYKTVSLYSCVKAAPSGSGWSIVLLVAERCVKFFRCSHEILSWEDFSIKGKPVGLLKFRLDTEVRRVLLFIPVRLQWI